MPAAFGDGVVLFGGGSNAGFFGDTWQFDGKHWIQRQDIGPGTRRAHTLAFDSTRNVDVMFSDFRADGVFSGNCSRRGIRARGYRENRTPHAPLYRTSPSDTVFNASNPLLDRAITLLGVSLPPLATGLPPTGHD